MTDATLEIPANTATDHPFKSEEDEELILYRKNWFLSSLYGPEDDENPSMASMAAA